MVGFAGKQNHGHGSDPAYFFPLFQSLLFAFCYTLMVTHPIWSCCIARSKIIHSAVSSQDGTHHSLFPVCVAKDLNLLLQSYKQFLISFEDIEW